MDSGSIKQTSEGKRKRKQKRKKTRGNKKRKKKTRNLPWPFFQCAKQEVYECVLLSVKDNCCNFSAPISGRTQHPSHKPNQHTTPATLLGSRQATNDFATRGKKYKQSLVGSQQAPSALSKPPHTCAFFHLSTQTPKAKTYIGFTRCCTVSWFLSSSALMRSEWRAQKPRGPPRWSLQSTRGTARP